jgi:translation initiation factor 2B subunit (eIF-2B alpha/beta/delta family)
MKLPDDIRLILGDRESGSVALLNRLISALEKVLRHPGWSVKDFSVLVEAIRKDLSHFAAIDNFLASLIIHTGPKESFPADAVQFIRDYRLYWHDSEGKIAENFLHHCNPGGKTILTHSHSETVICLLKQIHARQISFRVLQTLSSPGEEGKKSYARMRQMQIQAELTDDSRIKEALGQIDLIVIGCDAILSSKFLNKTGTRTILQQARQYNIHSCLVTESRKEITRPEWQGLSSERSLFEWVPLYLVDRVVTEQYN